MKRLLIITLLVLFAAPVAADVRVTFAFDYGDSDGLEFRLYQKNDDFDEYPPSPVSIVYGLSREISVIISEDACYWWVLTAYNPAMVAESPRSNEVVRCKEGNLITSPFGPDSPIIKAVTVEILP